MASIFLSDENTWRAQVYTYGVRTSATFRTKREASAWASQTEEKQRAEIKHRRDLEKKIGASKSPISANEILMNRITAPNVPGIYILFDGDMVTYVGQSRNVLTRIASHAGKGRAFTSYYVIPCLPDDLDRMERHYIEALAPPENKTQTVGVRNHVKPLPPHQPSRSGSSLPYSA